MVTKCVLGCIEHLRFLLQDSMMIFEFEICFSNIPTSFWFLGSSKRRRKEELLGKPFRRPQNELDANGLVPLPVKICYSCNRLVLDHSVHTQTWSISDLVLISMYFLSQELQAGSTDPVWLLSSSVPHGLSGPSTHSFTCWQMDVSKPCWALSGKRHGLDFFCLVSAKLVQQNDKNVCVMCSWTRGPWACPAAVSSLTISKTGCPSTPLSWTSCVEFIGRTHPTGAQRTSTTGRPSR